MSNDVLQRLEAVVAKLERVAVKLGAPAAGGDEKSAAVIEFEQLIASKVKAFVDNCNRLPALQPFGTLCHDAFAELRNVIDASVHCKKPSDAAFGKFLAPIAHIVETAQKTDNRSPHFNNQKAFAEFIQLVNWVLLPSPVQHIRGILDTTDFYLNKILSTAKDAAEPEKEIQRAFVAGIKGIVNDLADYAKNNFPAGLLWNPKGVDISQFHSGGGAAPAAAAPAPAEGAAPPPPPPVDPNFKIDVSAPADSGAAAKPTGGMAAVFGQLNQGEAITSGLKKVTADMKSKNRKDEPTLEPKESKKPAPAPASLSKAPAVKRDPVTDLRQGTWFVEYYDGLDVEVPEVQMKQSVFILKARNCTVNIPAKCKSVQLDSCFKVRVVFTSVVSSFELVNSERVTIVCNEMCPNIAIDKCSGVQIWLNDVSVREPPVIITSNVTEVNLVVPGKKPEDDPIELPLPQQYQSVYKNFKVSTEPVSHSAA